MKLCYTFFILSWKKEKKNFLKIFQRLFVKFKAFFVQLDPDPSMKMGFGSSISVNAAFKLFTFMTWSFAYCNFSKVGEQSLLMKAMACRQCANCLREDCGECKVPVHTSGSGSFAPWPMIFDPYPFQICISLENEFFFHILPVRQLFTRELRRLQGTHFRIRILCAVAHYIGSVSFPNLYPSRE